MSFIDNNEPDIFDEMSEFFDSKIEEDGGFIAHAEQTNTEVVGAKSLNEVNPLREKFFSRLEELGYNLDELKDFLDCNDNMLVLSCAGAGKTTGLIFKIIYDLLSGNTMKVIDVPNGYGGTNQVVVPCNVLVSTFLKTGAEELESEFKEWCQKLNIVGLNFDCIKFRTLHAEVYDAIRSMGYPLKISTDTNTLLKASMMALNIRSVMSHSNNVTVDEINDIAGICTYARNRLDDKRYEHSLMSDYNLTRFELDLLLNDYKIRRQSAGVVDFEDLQEILYDGLLTNENVRQFIANRYDCIYIDEFQDTSQLQYEIIKYYSAGCRKVVAIGDDDQCLAEGTLVETQLGIKKIEDVVIGDVVKTGIGNSKSDYHIVDMVSRKKVTQKLKQITTASGKVIKGTKDHIGFARLEPESDVHFVYLMYREDVGFRIGTTRGVRVGARGALRNGISQRLNQEKASKAWLLKKVDSENDAKYFESLYSYQYGIPQYIFKDNSRADFNMSLDFEKIQQLHRELDSKSRGMKLLQDWGYNYNYPHATAQAKEDRCTLNYTMFTSNQVDKDGIHKTELSASTKNMEYVEVLKDTIPTTLRKNGLDVPYYNARSQTSYTDNQVKAIKEIEKGCKDKGINLEVIKTAKLTEEKYSFMPLGNFIVGMKVPICLEDGTVVEDTVVGVEDIDYDGYVYDISVPATRNFVANGIIVHNCIYSWRGSDIDIISHIFERDFKPAIRKLTVNYRCSSNILNAVVPSIVKNTKRHEKGIKAYNQGGELKIIKDSNVNYLLESIKEDLTRFTTLSVIARTNADLLIPAILLELDGNVQFSVSKSVNIDGRLPRQVLDLMDLILKRHTEKFESMFKMFLGKYDQYQASKLDNILRINKQYNLFNIPIKDIEYSVPKLAPIVIGLRRAVEKDQVFGYIYLLELLKNQVYTGQSVYAQKARLFTDFIKKLIVEHKDLKNLSLYELDMLFNDVLKEKLNKRVRLGRNAKIKLTTVHEAKGKEWDSVYIWNDIDGCFPNSVGNRDLTPDEFEEERRVHYIAWTRARKKLTVFTTSDRMGKFLKECDLTNEGVIEERKSDIELQTKIVHKKPVELPKDLQEQKVDALDTEKIVRNYINKPKNDIQELSNMEIVLTQYSVDDLVELLDKDVKLSEYQSEFWDEKIVELLDELSDLIYEAQGGDSGF